MKFSIVRTFLGKGGLGKKAKSLIVGKKIANIEVAVKKDCPVTFSPQNYCVAQSSRSLILPSEADLALWNLCFTLVLSFIATVTDP